MTDLSSGKPHAMPLQTRKAQIPSGVRAYVIGDVHGMARLLADVFARIDADLTNRPVPCAVEIMLGDLIDRGPESATVLAMTVARQALSGTVCIAGNHELYMLEALEDQEAFEAWMGMGGAATVRSFGVVPPPEDSARNAFRAFRTAVPSGCRQLLSTMLPMHRLGDFLFVHAGLRPEVPIAQQSIVDLTTIRAPFLNSDVNHGYVVVHGHSRVLDVDVRGNRINVDTGAYQTGKLSCLVLEGESVRVL
jgi:serine/threonine protein phosphatase 1